MNTIVKRVPRARRSFDPFFSGVLTDIFNSTESITKRLREEVSPAANIYSEEDKFIIELAVPGLSKDQISISVDEALLTIKAEVEQSERNYRLKEFDFSAFTKSFKLSDAIDTESITAKVENGVLTIVLAQKEEAKPEPPKMIEIE